MAPLAWLLSFGLCVLIVETLIPFGWRPLTWLFGGYALGKLLAVAIIIPALLVSLITHLAKRLPYLDPDRYAWIIQAISFLVAGATVVRGWLPLDLLEMASAFGLFFWVIVLLDRIPFTNRVMSTRRPHGPFPEDIRRAREEYEAELRESVDSRS